MFQLYRENLLTVLAPQKPVLPHITETTRISDLAGRRFVLLFQRFRFTIDDVQFLCRAQSLFFFFFKICFRSFDRFARYFFGHLNYFSVIFLSYQSKMNNRNAGIHFNN